MLFKETYSFCILNHTSSIEYQIYYDLLVCCLTQISWRILHALHVVQHSLKLSYIFFLFNQKITTSQSLVLHVGFTSILPPPPPPPRPFCTGFGRWIQFVFANKLTKINQTVNFFYNENNYLFSVFTVLKLYVICILKKYNQHILYEQL